MEYEIISEESFVNEDSALSEEKGEIVSVREAALILGMTPRNIRYLVKNGKLPCSIKKRGKQLLYLFYREDVENFKWEKESISPAGKGNEENVVFPASSFSSKVLYPSQVELVQKEIRELYMELGIWKERANNNQFLLEERAQSIFEREAKIKELEAKLEEEKKGKEEISKLLEASLLKEKEEKEKLNRELLFKNISWWKKAFSSKEEIEREISKKLMES